MSYQTKQLSDTISDIIGAMSVTCTLRSCEYSQLLEAASDESLKEYERKTIRRLLRFVSKGRIKILDDLSCKAA